MTAFMNSLECQNLFSGGSCRNYSYVVVYATAGIFLLMNNLLFSSTLHELA